MQRPGFVRQAPRLVLRASALFTAGRLLRSSVGACNMSTIRTDSAPGLVTILKVYGRERMARCVLFGYDGVQGVFVFCYVGGIERS